MIALQWSNYCLGLHATVLWRIMEALRYLASPWADPNVKKSADGESLYALAGVRALAVTTVIASHTSAFGMFGQGSLGVLLFFMLSGFVLTIPFEKHPERILQWSAVFRFFSNRALRILPIFLSPCCISAGQSERPSHGSSEILVSRHVGCTFGASRRKSDFTFCFLSSSRCSRCCPGGLRG